MHRRVVLIALVVALRVAAAAAHEPPGPAAPAQAADPEESRRGVRLAQQAKQLEGSLAAVRAFGHGDDFLGAVKRLAGTSGDSKWITISDGFLPLVTVTRYVEWCAPEVEGKGPVATEFELSGHPGPVIVDLARQLREHGVDFLCVTFPSRIQLYPELVTDLKPDEKFAGMVEANTRFLLELTRQGVEVVDLAPAFAAARHVAGDDGNLLYLRSNLHWTPRGAELAAKVVADRVRAETWFKPGPWQEGRDFEMKERKLTFRSDFDGQAPGAKAELLVANVVKPTTSVQNRVEKRSSPITLLSDSFATFYDSTDSGFGWSSGFVSQLERFTSWPLDVIAPDGGAELGCRAALARRPDPLKGKQLVIWLLQEPNLRLAQQYRPVEIVAK